MSPGRTIVVGSTNRGKLREIQAVLGHLPAEFRSLAEYEQAEPPEETGNTFAENARLKALELARQVGEWVLADDSGLCVDALEGRPGVRSARYAGPKATDEENVAKLLLELRGVPDDERGAAFVCHVALADPQQVRLEADGCCRGRIIHEPRGTSGFGYDPVFCFPGFGATFAEVEAERKNRVSHRGQALETLAKSLEPLLT
jgi:XTP/dITP diphosphohydrolase